MKVAVISDVHGNRQALEAVLEAIAEGEASELWCLGEVVGYGADPDACVRLIRRHAAVCLAGNHDLGVVGELALEDFSRGASLAAQWTTEVIEPDNLAFLASLRPQGQEGPIGLYHASPRDPVWEYVLSTMLADACMDVMEPRIGAVGHSHVALYFWRQAPGAIAGEHAPEGTELDLTQGDWIINPGGVGQPRDGDPRAAWLLLDLETWHATWHRVEYPIDDAARAIQKAGLPVALSDRLYHGQ